MVEASQSALRVVLLVTFSLLFAGLWANDRPQEIMAQKEPMHSGSTLIGDDSSMTSMTELVTSLPPLEDIPTMEAEIVLTISVETDGLTLSPADVSSHIRQLPIGMASGDYMIVDPHGGVGWLRIRGQVSTTVESSLHSTNVGDVCMRFIRVTPVQVVSEETPTVR
ncbi:hypothetical protein AB1L42_20260 [Thalassoglobus sp. JC818]|uniref:hypothetical protein n=1 Tax=Thalassoglobus sp. JC818 TaxID=3232136 RepID=UPI00345A7EDD